LKETLQQVFLIWPQEAIGAGASWNTQEILPRYALQRDNSWVLEEQKADTIVVRLTSRARTDLNLCDPNAPDIDPTPDFDFLDDACSWYRKVRFAPMYAGQGNGLFTVDANSGLLRHASWTEELLGICPLRAPTEGKPEPVASPSKRTLTVEIEITPRGNNGTSKGDRSRQ
jgi:hypothetical protein